MPQKKRKVTSKTIKTKLVTKTKTTAKIDAQTLLTKSFFLKEQEEFYKKHPNAEMLLKVLMVTFVLLIVVCLKRYGISGYMLTN